jgi:hypothetical protein
MRVTRQMVLAIAFAVVPSVAFATHIPGGTEKIQYDGPLTPGVPSTGTIGWAAPIDGYDWYCFAVTKGAAVTINATRTSGDLKLNLGVMQGVAPADGSGTAGTLTIVTNTGNSTDPNVTLTFTPAFDGPATLWVSTWLGEKQGNYSVTMTGGKAGSGCGGKVVPPVAPTPQISVSVAPDDVLMVNDSSITMPVGVSVAGGFSSDVGLSVSGLPDDVLVTFDQQVFPAPGAGATNMTIKTSPQSFPGTYLVNVIGTGGDQTGGAAFTLIIDCSPPFILGLNQLKGLNVNRGSTARLEVVAGGSGPFFYQWYLGSSGLTNFPIANAKGKSFTTSAVNSSTPYWVRVSNACGSVDSRTATVSPQ